MRIKNTKPPCNDCPYKLGQVQTLVNPCPQCKKDGYRAYDRFKGNGSKVDSPGREASDNDTDANSLNCTSPEFFKAVCLKSIVID